MIITSKAEHALVVVEAHLVAPDVMVTDQWPSRESAEKFQV